MPALRAPLRCSTVTGRQKSLTLRQVWRLVPPLAPLLSGTEWGTARVRIPVQVRDIRMNQKHREKMDDADSQLEISFESVYHHFCRQNAIHI